MLALGLSTPDALLCPPLYAALLLAAGIGFISLGYEIVWYRIYSFASGRTASCFASLLAWYLAGIAYGSLVARDICRERLHDDPVRILRALATAVLWANIAAFLVAPALAITSRYNLIFPFVFIGAALLGASFPLLSHASIDPRSPAAGAKLSYLYLSNILGCACGSSLVGFVLMDHLSTKAISLVLLSFGIVLGMAVSLGKRFSGFSWRRSATLAFGLLVAGSSWNLYSTLYERLLFKASYSPDKTFSNFVETRSGVVAVTRDGTVYGGGVYDGRISTDLVADVNGIFRAFALDAMHPAPREVLIIGLSGGAWAQVIASNPQVERITIIEINPGYLQVIREYPAVSSILRDPKVQFEIDDGRRWLVRNPQKRFDAIVMNTSQHWLAHTSNLLSMEFLELIRLHLKRGGIHYYNTTFSPEAILTGATVFPYALRVGNFLAVSESPIPFDRARWASALGAYRIEGRPIFELTNPTHRMRFDEVLNLAETLHDNDPTEGMRIEDGESLRNRFRRARIITDNNMGAEWR